MVFMKIYIAMTFGCLLLASSASFAKEAKPKPFCTYAECMPGCQKSGGAYCSSYCTKEVAGRRVSGMCK
jgi:hypothetical protein